MYHYAMVLTWSAVLGCLRQAVITLTMKIDQILLVHCMRPGLLEVLEMILCHCFIDGSGRVRLAPHSHMTLCCIFIMKRFLVCSFSEMTRR